MRQVSRTSIASTIWWPSSSRSSSVSAPRQSRGATVTSNLAEYLERSAAHWPDRPAVVDPEGWSLSYAELNDQATRLAAFLVASGVRPGDRVGLCLPKGARA